MLLTALTELTILTALPSPRLCGGSQKFWPPTRESAPQLLLGWAGLAYVLWIFIREKRNKAVEQVLASCDLLPLLLNTNRAADRTLYRVGPNCGPILGL